MQKRLFGKTGLEVSVLGFGGAEIGFEGASQKDVEKLLNGALDAGLNVIDTAECYVDSEEQIGKAVGHRRKDYYLFTKCGHVDATFKEGWSKADIEKSIDRSLKRLKTDYLDLVQLHSPSEKILAKGEAIEALQKAKQSGKTRFIGYSGDSTDALYAIKSGAFDTLQTSLSIADQESIEITLPLAQEKKMGVIIKRPIANAAWRYSEKPANDYHLTYWQRLSKLGYKFINGNPEATGERALRFTLSVPGVHTMIVGTARPGRWQANSEIVAKGNLSDEEYDEIRSRWKAVADKAWVGQV
jgi:aryl-alcohol dehydrogenase-like predicted oxidoreductase